MTKGFHPLTEEDFLEEFSYRGHSAEASLELRAFVNNFKSCMRPQENN